MAYEDRIMRMADSVPQRTRPTMRDVAGPRINYNEGYGRGDVTVSDLPARPRAGDTPIQTGGSGFTRGEYTPPLYSGRNPFIQPIQTGGRQGEFPPMGGALRGGPSKGGRFGRWNFGVPGEVTPMGDPMGDPDEIDSGEFLSSRYGGGLDDAAGMNDDAMGMIEGAGFEVAGMTSDKRTEKKLWGRAVNSFPVGTPDMIIQQEWERLKQIFYDKKYGGGLGLNLPSRDDIVGLG